MARSVNLKNTGSVVSRCTRTITTILVALDWTYLISSIWKMSTELFRTTVLTSWSSTGNSILFICSWKRSSISEKYSTIILFFSRPETCYGSKVHINIDHWNIVLCNSQQFNIPISYELVAKEISEKTHPKQYFNIFTKN